MALLSFRNLTISFGDRPVLEQAQLALESRERVCLIGRNGEGKSTLLRFLAGEIAPDSGEIERPPSLKVGHLDQKVPDAMAGGVYDIIAEGLGERSARLLEYHRMIDRLEREPGNTALAEALGDMESSLTLNEDWTIEHQVESLITRLEIDPTARFETLSGGLKRRVLLGRALVTGPDLLLLDEPTNHLDLPAIEWLEAFLATLPCTLLFVTHDRSLVRKVATAILDLDRGRLTRWNCGYETYLARKAEALHAEARHWQVFDKKLAEEEIWIRKGIQARRTRNEGRVRALRKLRSERAERRDLQDTAKLAVQEGQTSGRKVITAKNLSYDWGDGEPVVRDFSTVVWRGDKIGLVGANGSGKSTLLRLLLGQLAPTGGEVVHGTSLEIAYFDQHRDQLDERLSVMENVSPLSDTVTAGGRSKHILAYLRDFLFSPATARAPIRKLSGGERARVLLARLFARPANVIVMDEPTNDLDLETIELLEELLLQFDGTVLLVSHDREFLDHIVTSTFYLPGGGSVYESVDLAGALEAFARESEVGGKPRAAPAKTPAAPRRTDADASPKKLTPREKNALAGWPHRIETMEAELEEIVAKLAAVPAIPDRERTAELTAAMKGLEAAIESAYAEWTRLEERAGAGEP
ncbi:MAG: ATP-binding cassette domain-containing protein [Puniceicoccaceae bacterium]